MMHLVFEAVELSGACRGGVFLGKPWRIVMQWE